MDDFETFKSSREKMDPTSRKMNDHQWKQAYAAHRSARKRSSGDAGDGEKSKKGRGRRTKSAASAASAASARGSRRPTAASGLTRLRWIVREQTAYADLRSTLDNLAWISIGLVVLAGAFTVSDYTSVPVAIASLLGTGLQVVGIILLRLLVHVLIDIPDIALFRCQNESSPPSQTSREDDY